MLPGAGQVNAVIGQGQAVVNASRPTLAGRLLSGRSIDDALSMIPLLFNVCGIAQGTTAVRALIAAGAIEENVDTRIARDLLVATECAREHLLRIATDWSGLYQLEADTSLLKGLGNLCRSLAHDLFESAPFDRNARALLDTDRIGQHQRHIETILRDAVFGMPTADWQQLKTVQALKEWADNTSTLAARNIQNIRRRGWSAVGAAVIRALPPFALKDIADSLTAEDGDGFIAEPCWHGLPAETSSLSRQLRQPIIIAIEKTSGHGLLARQLARLHELADIPARLARIVAGEAANDALTIDEHHEIAAVEASRGRLIHSAELDGERIHRYRVLAPTDWNFHPRGAACAALSAIDLPAPDRLQVAQCLISAIDPCVPFKAELSDA